MGVGRPSPLNHGATYQSKGETEHLSPIPQPQAWARGAGRPCTSWEVRRHPHTLGRPWGHRGRQLRNPGRERTLQAGHDSGSARPAGPQHPRTAHGEHQRLRQAHMRQGVAGAPEGHQSLSMVRGGSGGSAPASGRQSSWPGGPLWSLPPLAPGHRTGLCPPVLRTQFWPWQPWGPLSPSEANWCSCLRAGLWIPSRGAPRTQGPAPRPTLTAMILGVRRLQPGTEPGEPISQPQD